MIISRGRYTRAVQMPQSSNGTAAYLSQAPNLVDGSPTTQCAMSWPTGAQTTATWAHLPWRMVPAPAAECRVFVLAGLRGIPAGTRVDLYGGNTSNPAMLLASTETVLMPDGQVFAWVVRDAGDGWNHEFFAWRIYNDTAGESLIDAGAVVYIGELYAAPVWEWPVGRYGVKFSPPAQAARASAGVPRRPRRRVLRTVECSITPHGWAQAIGNADGTLQAMLYDLSDQDALVVIPRPVARGGDLGSDQFTVTRNGMFAGLAESSGLDTTAGDDHFPLTLRFDEWP